MKRLCNCRETPADVAAEVRIHFLVGTDGQLIRSSTVTSIVVCGVCDNPMFKIGKHDLKKMLAAYMEGIKDG